MQTLHPVFLQALAPFVAQPKSLGSIDFQRCGHTTPSPERGTERFEYTLGEVELACDLEFEAAERGSRERGTGLQLEPDHPARATLIQAYVRDVPIYELLSEEQHAEIETAFLAQGGAA